MPVKRSTGHTHTHRQRTTPPTPTYTRTRQEQHPKPKRTPPTNTLKGRRRSRGRRGSSRVNGVGGACERSLHPEIALVDTSIDSYSSVHSVHCVKGVFIRRVVLV